jgi:hypothetical protein
MPIDPRELARFRHVQPSVITTDRPCGRCGYNLKGLTSGAVCPECGTPSRRTGGGDRLNDCIANAPLHYLRTLMAGLFAMMLGCIGGAVILYFVPISIFKAVLLTAAGGIWWIGTFIVTAQRTPGPNAVRDPVLDSPRLRLTNRIIHASWIIAGIGWLGLAQTTGPGPASLAFVLMAALLPLIGLIGLVPLSIHLSALADWSGHSSLADRFRATAWAITACGILVLIGIILRAAAVTLAGFLALSFSAAIVTLVLSQLLFVVSLLQLVLTVQASISNANFAHEREQRRIDRLKHGHTDPERFCPQCNYSLQGLPALAPCPECGHLDPDLRTSPLAAIAAMRPKER